jgi:hypothetical protein
MQILTRIASVGWYFLLSAVEWFSSLSARQELTESFWRWVFFRIHRFGFIACFRWMIDRDGIRGRFEAGRVRQPGGGQPLQETDKSLLSDLLGLLEPDARGDPMSQLRGTCKSLRQLAAEMKRLGHKIGHTVVGEVLKQQKFSLQGNRKTREGEDHPDRDA